MMNRSIELRDLEEALLGIISSITQTPSEKVRHARLASSIATAKITSITTSAGIFGLVSTLGTAGTGTAIVTLSGAASTSATLAWIGGLVGGGMAAGALLLPAAGIAAGASAAMILRRKLHGRPRKLIELLNFEDEILFSTDNLIRPLDAISKGKVQHPTLKELRVYAHDGLVPLLSRISQHLNYSKDPTTVARDGDHFGTTLTPKYQEQLRRHCRVIHKHAVALSSPERKSILERLSILVAKVWTNLLGNSSKKRRVSYLSSVTMAVTFQRLLEDKFTAWTLEQDLVLDALRRSTKRLENASVDELSKYVQGLSPEQLVGVVSNSKGIYHEMLFVEAHNAKGNAVKAQLKEVTNFPGADVEFTLDGEVIGEVQLKAVSSPTLVYEHLKRYPEIDIKVTEETAAILEGIDSSGLSNAILTSDVTKRMHELQGEGLLDEVSDGIVASALVTSSFVVWNILKKDDRETIDFKRYLANAGIAAGTATIVDGAISLIGN